MDNIIIFSADVVIITSSAVNKLSETEQDPEIFEIFRTLDGSVLIFLKEQMELFRYLSIHYRQTKLH